MKQKSLQNKFLTLCFTSLFFLTGCASIGTAIKHKDLETSVQMSSSIFVDELAGTPKTVFIKVKNTTDKKNFNISNELINAIQNNGYKVTQDAQKAGFVLQVNLLKIGPTSQTAAEEMLGYGYGGAVEGAVAGGAVGAVTNSSVLGFGLIGAVAGTVADNLVKDVTFAGVVDLQMLQKTKKEHVTYTTRILVTANQVNLKFEEAQPALKDGLVTSISGLL